MAKADSITFSVIAEQVVVNTTVKIVAQIATSITSEITEDTLGRSIREVLQKFIPADWQLSGMNRTSDNSRMERVTLTATARVGEKENYALDRRRTEASRDGLNIYAAIADTSPTSGQIEDTESKLRLELIGKAKKELALINEATGDTYRLGKIEFNPTVDASTSNRPQARMLGSASASATYGSGMAPDDTIGNAVKLTMLANVVLRITR